VYKSDTSGWDGRYSLGDIAPGTYTLEASLIDTTTGKVSYCAQGVTIPGAALPLDLILEEGCSVSYALNGGGGTPPASRNVKKGTVITLPGGKGMTAPLGSGTAFLRWEAGGQTYQGGSSYPVTANVRFKAKWGVFTTVAEVAAYLAEFVGEGISANPLPLPVSIELSSTGSDNWTALLSALQTAGEYVDLNLSGSTMSGTNFNPGSATGQQWIVCLTLPDAATSIAGGSESAPTFGSFSNLQEITGAKITSIGQFAFMNRTTLSSVNFPKATAIGQRAFENTGMSTVYLPAATSIDYGAFRACNSLKSANLPALTTISQHTFLHCYSLESVILPSLTTIHYNPFTGGFITSITINAGCSIDSRGAGIHYNNRKFDIYYETKGRAGGVYIYDQRLEDWTGPF
jgi:hypothetical protein